MSDKEILNEILRYSVQLEVIQAQLASAKQQCENGMETVDKVREQLNALIKELSKEQNE